MRYLIIISVLTFVSCAKVAISENDFKKIASKCPGPLCQKAVVGGYEFRMIYQPSGFYQNNQDGNVDTDAQDIEYYKLCIVPLEKNAASSGKLLAVNRQLQLQDLSGKAYIENGTDTIPCSFAFTENMSEIDMGMLRCLLLFKSKKLQGKTVVHVREFGLNTGNVTFKTDNYNKRLIIAP